jgi:hypothetical protein
MSERKRIENFTKANEMTPSPSIVPLTAGLQVLDVITGFDSPNVPAAEH